MRMRVFLKSPVLENGTPGSVRGASGNRRPYRDGFVRTAMPGCTFSHLYEAVGDSNLLDTAYDKVLMNLFESPFWEGGTVEHRRILWSQGRQARTEDTRTFRSPGLYLWGVEDRPLYIGITRGSFDKRFSRYIWHERSQCNLAQDFEAALVSNDINGFPVEIREWYARQFGGSKVRLRGAVRFAKEGIARVWFALFPHNSQPEIEKLERVLVPVAEAWNCRRGLAPLLNIEFNRRTGRNNKVLKKEASGPTPEPITSKAIDESIAPIIFIDAEKENADWLHTKKRK